MANTKRGYRKNFWASSEDEVLRALVMKYGARRWTNIAVRMTGRSPLQCRDRWINHLDPSINNKSFTDEEDKLLIDLVQHHGSSWATIAERFNDGRTDCAMKNRYLILMRRGMAPPAPPPKKHPLLTTTSPSEAASRPILKDKESNLKDESSIPCKSTKRKHTKEKTSKRSSSCGPNHSSDVDDSEAPELTNSGDEDDWTTSPRKIVNSASSSPSSGSIPSSRPSSEKSCVLSTVLLTQSFASSHKKNPNMRNVM